MDIERVNNVLSKAIVAFQAEEIAVMSEAMAGSYEVKPPSAFSVPTPAEMHKKHGMPVPSGTVKSGLIGKGEARRGMKLGNWIVVDASPTKVTIQIQNSETFTSGRSKAFTHKWDGVGYEASGSYLHFDGFHKLPGSKPAEFDKLYPEGTVIQSREKWTWIIVGKGKRQEGGYRREDYYEYPVTKLKGKKIFKLSIEESAYGGADCRVDDGKKWSYGLSNPTVRPPR